MAHWTRQLDNIQEEVTEWAARNFPTTTAEKSYRPLLGAVEELGELAHAHLKEEQGIRGTKEEHEAAAKDALGDTLVFLLHYASLRGWSLWDCLETAWGEVKQRDWLKNQTDGKAREEHNFEQLR